MLLILLSEFNNSTIFLMASLNVIDGKNRWLLYTTMLLSFLLAVDNRPALFVIMAWSVNVILHHGSSMTHVEDKTIGWHCHNAGQHQLVFSIHCSSQTMVSSYPASRHPWQGVHYCLLWWEACCGPPWRMHPPWHSCCTHLWQRTCCLQHTCCTCLWQHTRHLGRTCVSSLAYLLYPTSAYLHCCWSRWAIWPSLHPANDNIYYLIVAWESHSFFPCNCLVLSSLLAIWQDMIVVSSMLSLCCCSQCYRWRFAPLQLPIWLIHIDHKVSCCLCYLGCSVVAINFSCCLLRLTEKDFVVVEAFCDMTCEVKNWSSHQQCCCPCNIFHRGCFVPLWSLLAPLQWDRNILLVVVWCHLVLLICKQPSSSSLLAMWLTKVRSLPSSLQSTAYEMFDCCVLLSCDG